MMLHAPDVVEVLQEVFLEGRSQVSQNDLVQGVLQRRLNGREPALILPHLREALLRIEEPLARLHIQRARVLDFQVLVCKDELVAQGRVTTAIGEGCEGALLEVRELLEDVGVLDDTLAEGPHGVRSLVDEGGLVSRVSGRLILRERLLGEEVLRMGVHEACIELVVEAGQGRPQERGLHADRGRHARARKRGQRVGPRMAAFATEEGELADVHEGVARVLHDLGERLQIALRHAAQVVLPAVEGDSPVRPGR
mmetsp:Transcript_36601/g.83303  ORF Transcript_36601/g.83303 Transcript_36601/m.83303 type:complete len:253 (-) Transcript_36601:1137-1895(-)